MLILILGTIAVVGLVISKTADSTKLAKPFQWITEELKEGFHILVDRPQNTSGRDDSTGATTTEEVAEKLTQQYQTEALNDPGVRMAANAIE